MYILGTQQKKTKNSVFKYYFDFLRQQFYTYKNSKYFKVFALDVLSKGADFLFLPIYLRLLSQEEFGLYTYIIYIVTTASGIIKLGLDTAASKMYYEGEKYDRSKMLFSVNSMWIGLFSLIVGVSIISDIDNTLFIKLLNIPTESYFQIRYFVFAYILFNLVQTTLNVFYVIDDNAIQYQKYNFFRTFFGNGIVLILLYFVIKDNRVFFRLSIEPILFIVSFLPLLYHFIKKIKFQFEWDAAKHGLQIGLPMVGTLLVGVVYNLSDKYFLQKSSGYDTLAIYNLSIFLTLPISLVFSSFQTVWFPKFLQIPSVERFGKSNQAVKKLGFLYSILFMLMYVCIFVLISAGIIPKEYGLLMYTFPLIYLSKVLDNLVQIYNNFVVAWGKTMFNLIISIIFSIFTLGLNYYFIPSYGIAAAIIILTLLSLMRISTFYLFVKRESYGTIY